MFNQMVYDVFILRKERDKKTEKNLRCRSRFGEDLKEFSQKGLKFRCGTLYVRGTASTQSLYSRLARKKQSTTAVLPSAPSLPPALPVYSSLPPVP